MMKKVKKNIGVDKLILLQKSVFYSPVQKQTLHLHKRVVNLHQLLNIHLDFHFHQLSFPHFISFLALCAMYPNFCVTQSNKKKGGGGEMKRGPQIHITHQQSVPAATCSALALHHMHSLLLSQLIQLKRPELCFHHQRPTSLMGASGSSVDPNAGYSLPCILQEFTQKQLACWKPKFGLFLQWKN